ncbi:MAG: proline--tRNA ligase [Proteobacteria bacterium]|nr:proline--tRNA ligase [Pseudomonadota bacterium]NBP14931.1 proline--tRNA ligase [bacterium]
MNKLPDIKTQFPEWYQEIIYQAELVDQSPVRGCMVIRPYGNAIWEEIKGILDRKIKESGAENAVFPLLIPESFLKREAEHIEGFAPELAVVTHAGGKKLEEALVIRPTSETIIHHMFAQWIKSWRDLPLKINQWANVVRWEKRPRAFLRTTEFFWQEGHTAHASKEDAQKTTEQMLEIYRQVAEDCLAIPVQTGRKSEGEKFPGAEKTYTFEGFMPDARALQMGTSHLLSQNFAKAFDMQFQNKAGQLEYPWLTSWGSTTRLVGAVVMTHGDQKGLVLPPVIAPIQVIIIPIYKTEEEKTVVLHIAEKIRKELQATTRIRIDDDQQKTPGNKFFHWELRGVPIRIEIGPRDLKNNEVVIADRLGSKATVALDSVTQLIPTQLTSLQKTMFDKAKQRTESLIIDKDTLEEIKTVAETNVIKTGFCGSRECEGVLKQYTLSIRCLLLDQLNHQNCFNCQKPSQSDCFIARSY